MTPKRHERPAPRVFSPPTGARPKIAAITPPEDPSAKETKTGTPPASRSTGSRLEAQESTTRATAPEQSEAPLPETGAKEESAVQSDREPHRKAESMSNKPESHVPVAGWISILLGLVCLVLVFIYLQAILQVIQGVLADRPENAQSGTESGGAMEENHNATPATSTTPSSSVDLSNPVEVVKAFHQAKTLDERLQYVIESGPEVEESMLLYYEQPETIGGPLTNLSVAGTGFDPDTGRSFAKVRVRFEDREEPLVIHLVRNDDEAFRLSWFAYVQFKERLLEKFSEDTWHGWSHFCVELKRADGSDGIAPNDSVGRAWYILSSPEAPEMRLLAHVASDGPTEATLQEKLPGTEPHAVWVELRHDGRDGIEIMSLLRESWDPTPRETDSHQEAD